MTAAPNWTFAALADLAACTPRAITDGPFGSALKTEHYTEAGARVIRLTNIGRGVFIDLNRAYVDQARFAALQNHEAIGGDLVTAALGDPLGRTCILPPDIGPALVKADCFRLRPHPLIEREYLNYWLNSPLAGAAFAELSHGVGRTRITLADFKASMVPVAPQCEQRRIVAKIGSLSAQSMRARVELERVEALAGRARQAVLKEAFRPFARQAKVGDIVSAVEAGKNVRCDERPPRSNEKGLVKVSAVTWGEFDPSASKTLGPREVPLERNRIRAGDFLFSRANTLELVGACVIVREDPNNLYLSDKILRLNMADVDKGWLLWYLRSLEGREGLQSASSGNQLSMRNISQAGLLSLAVPLIPDHEKERLAARIDSQLMQIARAVDEAKAAARLLNRLDQAVLAKAFRGELVPQDPDDEPASMLLDQIRTERQAAGAAPRRRGRRSSAASANA